MTNEESAQPKPRPSPCARCGKGIGPGNRTVFVRGSTTAALCAECKNESTLELAADLFDRARRGRRAPKVA